MNPLEKIENWLIAQPEAFRKELIYYACFFHPSEEVQSLSLDPEEPFWNYLGEKNIKPREISTRSLIVIKLIDAAFSGRDTEASWAKFLDRNLALASRSKEEGFEATHVNHFLNGFSENKTLWINKSEAWEKYKALELHNEAIADWYFSEVIDRR